MYIFSAFFHLTFLFLPPSLPLCPFSSLYLSFPLLSLSSLTSPSFVSIPSSSPSLYPPLLLPSLPLCRSLCCDVLICLADLLVVLVVVDVLPSVIEPSFGLGRLLYVLWEHSYGVREGDEKRVWLALDPQVAPISCSVLTLSSNSQFNPFISTTSM